IMDEPMADVTSQGENKRAVLSLGEGGRKFSWLRSVEGDLSAPAFTLGSANQVYEQVMAPPAEAGVSMLHAASDDLLEHLRNCQSVPQLQIWARGILPRLVAQGRLPAAVLGPAGENDRVSPEYYEIVGKAFEAYLALSGEFKYSLNLTRQDMHIDPVEDFVLNTRKGHCSRYASA